VVRLGMVTPVLALLSDAPLAKKIFLAAAVDLVLLEENADLVNREDIALQGVFALFYRPCPRVFAGAYVAVRDQYDAAGTGLTVAAFDLYGHLRPVLIPDLLELELAGEVAYLHGESDRLLTEAAPGAVAVRALAAVGRAGLRAPRYGLRVGFELGVATGDGNPHDNTSTQFRMDPDYQPSLILWSRYLSAVTARGAERAADRDLVGQAPPGVSAFPSQGAVFNAVYLQPVLAYTPPWLLDGALSLKVGYLYARALAALFDPSLTFRNGGVPTTAMGHSAALLRTLGHELNMSIAYRGAVSFGPKGELCLLYGRLWPGPVFHDLSGEAAPVDLVQLRATLRY